MGHSRNLSDWNFPLLAIAGVYGACILAGCGHDPQPLPSPPPPPPVVTVKAVCPSVKIYSAADQAALAGALAALPPTSPLVGAMVDYKNLRDRLRACNAP